MTDTLTLQNKLLSVNGSTGAEEKRAELIAELVRPLCDEVSIDPMYNVIARKKGDGPKAMVSAHMDTLGFLVTMIEPNGFLRFERVGGISPNVAMDTVIEFENGVKGKVWRYEDEQRKKIKLGGLQSLDLYIDIGAKDAEEAAKLVPVGSIGHYDGKASIMGSGVIVSPYLDDLISCVAQIQALEELKGEKCPNDIYFVFSTQEEVGLRGARAASFSIDPDWGFSIDVSPTGDGREEARNVEVSLGKGPAICSQNGSLVVDTKVVRYFRKIADEHGIHWQNEILPSGGTDAGAIQHAPGGAAASGLGIPTRYTHTPSEMASLDDIQKTVELTCALLRADPRGGIL